MGNFIIDFVDKELLEHKKKKEKLNQQENAYVLQEAIKNQNEINSKNKIKKWQKEGIVQKWTKKENKKWKKKQISSLEELSEEYIIPPQQKDNNSIVSKDIMNILKWTNIEESILLFNEEDIGMDTNNSNGKKLEKKPGKKKNKLKTIIFQATIGIILILISLLYLVDSPAEQKVLESGMSIWVDKIKSLLWNSNEYLHNKFLTDLEENRKKTILWIDNTLSKIKDCNMTGTDFKKDIQQLKNLKYAIENMSLDKFKKEHMNIEMQVDSIENGETIQKCY